MLGPLHMRQHAFDLVPGQHDGQTPATTRADQTVELPKLPVEDRAVEEEQRAQSLRLGRRADSLLDRQVREKGIDLPFPHLPRMPLAMKEDVAPDPVDIRLLRAIAHVPHPQALADPIQQSGLFLRTGAAHAAGQEQLDCQTPSRVSTHRAGTTCLRGRPGPASPGRPGFWRASPCQPSRKKAGRAPDRWTDQPGAERPPPAAGLAPLAHSVAPSGLRDLFVPPTPG